MLLSSCISSWRHSSSCGRAEGERGTRESESETFKDTNFDPIPGARLDSELNLMSFKLLSSFLGFFRPSKTLPIEVANYVS